MVLIALLGSNLVLLTQQGGNRAAPQKTKKTVHTGEPVWDGTGFFMKLEPYQEVSLVKKGYQGDLCVYALKFKSI